MEIHVRIISFVLMPMLIFLSSCVLLDTQGKALRERHFQAAEILIDRIDAYYQEHGEFPASLDVLGLANEHSESVDFHYTRGDSDYLLMFAYLMNEPPLMVCTRTKDTEWRCGRHR